MENNENIINDVMEIEEEIEEVTIRSGIDPKIVGGAIAVAAGIVAWYKFGDTVKTKVNDFREDLLIKKCNRLEQRYIKIDESLKTMKNNEPKPEKAEEKSK